MNLLALNILFKTFSLSFKFYKIKIKVILKSYQWKVGLFEWKMLQINEMAIFPRSNRLIKSKESLAKYINCKLSSHSCFHPFFKFTSFRCVSQIILIECGWLTKKKFSIKASYQCSKVLLLMLACDLNKIIISHNHVL